MYSHPFDPQPSTIPIDPEFLTANLSPALPDANILPLVDPYKTVFPMITLLFDIKLLFLEVLTIIFPPDKPLPT